MMARNLDLQRGGNRFIKTAAYGHFGRDDLDVFTWEKVQLPHRHQSVWLLSLAPVLFLFLRLGPCQ